MTTKRRTIADADKQSALFPVAMTFAAVLGLGALTGLGAFGPALCLGVAAGAVLFLRGAAANGRLGNAHGIGQSRADVVTRLGACLALAGVAAGTQGHDPPWPWTLRALIGIGQLIVSVLAVRLAAQQVKQTRLAKETKGRDEITAKPL